MNKYFMIVLLILVLFWSVSACNNSAAEIEVGQVPQDVEDVFNTEVENVSISNWIEGLEIPWQLLFFPDEEIALVTERPGRIRIIKDDQLLDEPYAEIDVAHRGEGGLMGMALHPDFPEKPYIYIMYTYQEQGELYNRVARIIDRGDIGEYESIIIDGIPGSQNHNGGRIAFGPDGMLYVTTGDTWQRQMAQDLDKLGGKILRLTPEGNIPEDNPYNNSPVYSLGHRNPQGLTWHQESGDLFISDHGPSGEDGLQAKDMIKVIKPGGNYGWPEKIGFFEDNQFINPLIMWSVAVPPSGITFYNNDLLVATLRSEALIRIELDRVNEDDYQVEKIERWFAEDYFSGVFGRLRDIVEGPDGDLYLITNNRDGRGTPREGDDKIIRLTVIE